MPRSTLHETLVRPAADRVLRGRQTVTMKAALQQYDTSEHTNERPHYGKRMPAHMEKVGRHDAPQPWLPS